MWMRLDEEKPLEASRLRLDRVSDEGGWAEMREARTKVESAFGASPKEAARMVDHIRHRQHFLNGEWYLARLDGVVVGETGLVVFETHLGRLGRLQDVDILPEFQGRGLGDALINEIMSRARSLGCDALCLRADADDWPKDWYASEAS